MKARPTYAFLGEEAGEIEGTDGSHRWIVEPLDGATNFLHGVAQFAIAVALERQGEIVASLVFNPALDELFTAERGGGAFLNDRRLRVAARRTLSDCVIATGIPYLGRSNHGTYLVELRHVMGEVAGLRSFGAPSLDLAQVAAGRFDGFWERGLDPWQIAAGMLLVREAGGWVSDIDGGNKLIDSRSIIAGNEYIRKALQDVVHRPDSRQVILAGQAMPPRTDAASCFFNSAQHNLDLVPPSPDERGTGKGTDRLRRSGRAVRPQRCWRALRHPGGARAPSGQAEALG